MSFGLSTPQEHRLHSNPLFGQQDLMRECKVFCSLCRCYFTDEEAAKKDEYCEHRMWSNRLLGVSPISQEELLKGIIP